MMGREILFRGKRIDNGEWVYGDLAHHENGTFICNWIGEACQYKVIAETVGQFTGRLDTKQKKIFEGDTYTPYYFTPFGEKTNELDDDLKGVIVYDSQYCQFVLETFYDKHKRCITEGEIIGNIHEGLGVEGE